MSTEQRSRTSYLMLVIAALTAFAIMVFGCARPIVIDTPPETPPCVGNT